jgi:hypothetical protein
MQFLPIRGRNFQRVSTNRFVVDSDRFWRAEFHPRFKHLFDNAGFISVFQEVNASLPYPVEDEFMNTIARRLFSLFAEYRFSVIPKDQESEQFLSELFFALLDIFTQFALSHYPLVQDDFNVVTGYVESGKQDHTLKDVKEGMESGSGSSSEANILTQGKLNQRNKARVENIDDESNDNTVTVDDLFNSPQDQGVLPTVENTRFEGVDGVTPNGNGRFTTSTGVNNTGSTTKARRNTGGNEQEGISELIENNDIKQGLTKSDTLDSSQSLEIGTQKNDKIVETLAYDKAQKLQEFYDLNKDRLFLELINRLSRWILQVNIATADTNYVGYERFE